MKKIGFLISTLDLGGAERQLVNTVNSLDIQKYEITIFVLKNKIAIVNQLNSNIKIEVIGLKKYYNIFALYKCLSIIKKNRPDILHSVMYTSNILSRIYKLFNRKVKVVNHIHGLGTWKKKYHIYIDRVLLPFVNKLLVVSEASKKLRLSREKYPENKIEVLYNSIDTKKFYVSNKVANKVFTFGTASRLIELKQVDKTIELVSSLKERGIITHLLIAGEGPLEKQLMRLVKEKKLEGQVFFKGRLDSMIDFYHKIDCLLLFSRTEDLPMVIIEAFASGLPVISSNVGGVSELINPNIGLLIDNDLSIDSQVGFISKFISMLDTEETEDKNTNFAVSFFDNRVHKKNIEEIYSNI